MLIDLLNSANYIMVNRDAIKILGLIVAVYCSELLNIYKKAVEKKKLIDEKAFKIDRGYIQRQTSISIEDQLACDQKLRSVGILQIAKEDPDIVIFDVEVFASLLSSQDVKLLSSVSINVNKKVNGTKQAQRDRQILQLKESIVCDNYEVLVALRDWIDSVMANPTKFLSKQQVALFKQKLDDYCGKDTKKMLSVIEIATARQYMDCAWAIKAFEQEGTLTSRSDMTRVVSVRTNQTKKTNGIGGEIF